jgi:hypothetical protein
MAAGARCGGAFRPASPARASRRTSRRSRGLAPPARPAPARLRCPAGRHRAAGREEAGAVRAQRVEHLARAADSAASSATSAPAGLLPVAQASRSHSSDRRAADRAALAARSLAASSLGRHQTTRPAAHSLSSISARSRFTRAASRSGSQADAGAATPSSWRSTAASPASPSRRSSPRAAHRQLVPAEQEAHELRRRHRLDLGAQPVARVAVHAREQAPVAPFGCARRGERAAHRAAFGLELQQRRQHGVGGRPSGAPSAAAVTGPEQIEAAAHDLAQRVVGCGLLARHGVDRGRQGRGGKQRLELMQAFGRDVQRERLRQASSAGAAVASAAAKSGRGFRFGHGQGAPLLGRRRRRGTRRAAR